ncbi:MAG: hypothetical protein LLG04_08020 [Parachlamydia sp.]|nr:hypothetical protein [Parachlamydia sp.]
MKIILQRAFHEVNYPEKSRLEMGADALLKPARYLFRGKSITIVKGKISSEQLSCRERSWIKTALMILLLIPSLLVGLPLKSLCYVMTPSYLRRLKIPSPRKPEFDRVFSPQLFKPYRQQLQECLKSELSKKPALLSKLHQDPFLLQLRTLLRITDETIPETSSSYRAWHERWLTQLRKLIQLKEKLPAEKNSMTLDVLQILDRLSLWMYTEVKLQDVHLQFLKQAGMQVSVHPLPANCLAQTLGESWKRLKANPIFNNYAKEISLIHDTHLKGNLPFLQFRIDQTQLIYTGRVTRENTLTRNIELYPEFLQYLDALAAQNKRHLYINLLNRTKGSEREIALKIEGFERLKKALSVVTLDNNSNFYKQDHDFEKLNDAHSFKEAFYKHLFAAEGAYYWPKHLDATWRQVCHDILNTIHQTFFAQKEKLTVAERQAFIDLTHLFIIRSLFKDVSFANTTCKHSMDRGPRQAALLLSNEIRQQPTLMPDKVNQFLTTILAPPLLTHNRVPLERFVKRIQNTLSIQLQSFA